LGSLLATTIFIYPQKPPLTLSFIYAKLKAVKEASKFKTNFWQKNFFKKNQN